MRRALSTCGSKGLNRIEIVWDKGEAFDVFLKARPKRQPRTLITYFPALVFNQHSATHQPTASSF